MEPGDAARLVRTVRLKVVHDLVSRHALAQQRAAKIRRMAGIDVISRGSAPAVDFYSEPHLIGVFVACGSQARYGAGVTGSAREEMINLVSVDELQGETPFIVKASDLAREAFAIHSGCAESQLLHMAETHLAIDGAVAQLAPFIPGVFDFAIDRGVQCAVIVAHARPVANAAMANHVGA